MVIHEPLDLQYWFVTTLSGSYAIFWFLSLIVIAGAAASFKMNNIAFGIMLALFSVLMAAFGATWMLILACVIGGLVIFYSISKILK